MQHLAIWACWRAWRYQRGNQNPYIEEQTAQWPTEKVQKDKQRSTKHTSTHTNTTKNGVELRFVFWDLLCIATLRLVGFILARDPDERDSVFF
jgi:ABC-type nickel/cobalt efflux system permease component RcnA